MRILVIRSFPQELPLESQTYNIQGLGLAKALVRKGHHCDLVYWTAGKSREVVFPVEGCDDITAYFLHGKAYLKNGFFDDLDRLVDNYDILQISEYNQMESWRLAKKYPKKTIIYHGPYYSPFNKRYNLMCSVFDLFCTGCYRRLQTPFLVKSPLAAEFLTARGIDSAHIYTAGVGINLEMLCGSGEPHPFAQQMQQQTNGPRLLYIGRIEPRRNPRFLMDVLRQVLETAPDAKLYFIGAGNKDYVQSVFDYAASIGVCDAVVWRERLEQKYLAEVYRAADIFLLPTEYEIFGMVLMEAMYNRCAVLTTRNGGSEMLIRSGENGYILPTGQPEAWAAQILQLLGDRPALEQLQQAASQTVEREFQWDARADVFLKAFQALLAR